VQQVGPLLAYIQAEMEKARSGKRERLPYLRTLCTEACANVRGMKTVHPNVLCDWIEGRGSLERWSPAEREQARQIREGYPAAYLASRTDAKRNETPQKPVEPDGDYMQALKESQKERAARKKELKKHAAK